MGILSDVLKGMGLNSFQRALGAVLTLAVGLILIKYLMKLVGRALSRSRLEKAAHSMVLGILQVTLYLLLGINVASALGIDVTGVVAVASVLTLAVSLAMQNLLTNLVGGFTILTTHPFHSGDFVDIGEESGTVDEISMTYTRLITPDNKVVFVPNSTVEASQITNYTVGGTRRAEIKVTASYDMEAQDVIDALLQAAQGEKVLQDPAPFAALTSYDDSAIGYVLRFWAKTEDYWDVYFQVNQRIQAVFAENKIEMCYPHLNVHLDKQQ